MKAKHYLEMLKLKIILFGTFTKKNIINEKNVLKKILIIILMPFNFIKILLGIDLYIPYVEVLLTTYCTLNCKGCSALMGYYKKRKNYNKDDVIKWIQKLVDASTMINHLKLIGGEPLLYPELYDVLFYLKKQPKVKRICIVTNGTMTITDDKILELLKDRRFYISISNYGNVSKNKDSLISQLKKNNIKYFLMSNDYEWIDYGDFKKRNRSEKVFISQFNQCTHRCRSLLNGKLFHCFRNSHGTNLKLVPLIKKEYVDLTSNKSNKELKKELYKFLYHFTPYIETCKYCDCIKNSKIIKKGIQPKGKGI